MSTQLPYKSYGHHSELKGMCTIHVLNHKELLVVPRTPKLNCLWRFDLDSKQPNKWYEYPDDTTIAFSHHSSALSDDKSKLYIFGDPGYLITV